MRYDMIMSDDEICVLRMCLMHVEQVSYGYVLYMYAIYCILRLMSLRAQKVREVRERSDVK